MPGTAARASAWSRWRWCSRRWVARHIRARTSRRPFWRRMSSPQAARPIRWPVICPTLPAAVRLRAERRGDGFVLSGTKRFVPFAHVADLVLVAARTGGGQDGTSVFVVKANAAGLRLTPNVQMDHTSKTSTLVLEDVRVG